MPMEPLNEDPGPRGYRARKNRPCDACRRRKICCVKESSSLPCNLCQMRSQQCTYLSKPRKRRRQEKAGITRSKAMRADSSAREETGTPSSSDEVHHLSTLRRSLLEHASVNKTANTPAEEWIPQFVGLSGDQDPYVLRHCQFRNNRYKRHGWACVRVVGEGNLEPTHFSVVPDSHLDAWPAWYPAYPDIDVSSLDHQNMIQTYLSVVHASYPLLEPALLRKPLSQMYRPLIGAAYQLTQNVMPDLPMTAAEITYQWRVFLYQALPIEAKHPRLETLEAGLCFIQRKALIHRAPTTPGLWSEIGSLVGVGHDLGINVDPTSWEIEASQKSRRVRIAWALFTADKWAALGLGRPSYISKDDWSVPMVTEADFPDPETPESAKGVFIAMSKLSLILAEVLHKFYTIKAQHNIRLMSAGNLLALMKRFEQELELVSWTTLGLETPELSTSDDSMLDPTGTLDLAYYTVRVAIYRAVLRYLPPGESYTVRQSARTVLLDTVELLSNLRVSRLRAFWWSPLCGINFAIVGSFMFSMLLSSIDETEVEFWMTIIDRYKRLLDLQSVSFDITKLAARRLELLGAITDVASDETAFNNDEVWGLFM